mmetsp:Transcript_43868/g.111650  ORF Transcript_43868/g.111650 Transcript_43868/m.111650 type:complete len:495 (-) Transcript_43868:109-1593(-)
MRCGLCCAVFVGAVSYPLALLAMSYRDFLAIYEARAPPTNSHAQRVQRLLAHVNQHGIGNMVQKKTNSNRFQYGNVLLSVADLIRSRHKMLPLGDLRHVLEVDVSAKTVTVEGACSMLSLADALLPKGFMLPIHPEMVEITVGGAIAGIGIEAAGHKHGFFHDHVLAMDVLCADGEVRTATATNQYFDLFQGLPNSYGTLGYVLKATLRIVPAAPYVHMRNRVYKSLRDLHADMGVLVEARTSDFLEALVFNDTYAVLSETSFMHDHPKYVDDIYHSEYRLVVQKSDVYLPTKDYLFRFEPDLFFNWFPIGRNAFQDFVRWAADPSLRNSQVYRALGFRIESKIDAVKQMIYGPDEPLIQDWEVPWPQGYDFLREVLATVMLPPGKPWLILPIRPQTRPTNYPVEVGTAYLNLGVYLKSVGVDDGRSGGFFNTKFIDALTIKYKGIKMLYSTSFATRAEYTARYNGTAYAELKAKYDSGGKFKTLFEKCFNNAF